MKKALQLLALIVATVVVVRVFFPRNEQVVIPKIETVWDTVETVVPQLDTVWRTRIIARSETIPNVIETVTVQAKPETVTITLQAVCPQSLQAGNWGDRQSTTVIEGRTYTYDSTKTLLQRPWRASYYTAGPIDAMVGDTFPPRLTFKTPPKQCDFFCRLGLFGWGSLAGAAITGTACAVLK